MDVGTTSGQVSDGTETVKQKTQEGAVEVVERTRGLLRTQVDQRSTQAGEHARTAAETLRQTASQLRQDGDSEKARYAGFADQGADRLERLGGYLTSADADELLARVEALGRKRPWLVVGSGLLGGLVAARFLKASSESRYRGVGQSSRVTTDGAWERSELPPASELTPGPASDRPVSWEEHGVGAYQS
jgi:hypothetical protein